MSSEAFLDDYCRDIVLKGNCCRRLQGVIHYRRNEIFSAYRIIRKSFIKLIISVIELFKNLIHATVLLCNLY